MTELSSVRLLFLKRERIGKDYEDVHYTEEERYKMYDFLYELEFNMLGLIKPDMVIFLHMPYECSCILKQGRAEAADQNEADPTHLINAERAFKEVADMYGFETIECGDSKHIKTIDEVKDFLTNSQNEWQKDFNR